MRLPRGVLVVLVMASLYLGVTAELPADGRQGFYVSLNTSFGKHLLGQPVIQRFDFAGGSETDFIPSIDYSVGYGLAVGYTGSVAAGEFFLKGSQEERLGMYEGAIEIDGEERWAWGPAFSEAGFAGRFFLAGAEGLVSPFLTYGLMFRCMTLYDGSIDNATGQQSNSYYLGDGYELGIGCDLNPLTRLWVSARVELCGHRYMWVRGALAEPFALPEPIEDYGIRACATACLLVRQTGDKTSAAAEPAPPAPTEPEPGDAAPESPAPDNEPKTPLEQLLDFFIWGL